MARAHSKVMNVSNVRLRKLRKTPYLKFGQNDELRDLQELGLAIDAVPCGGLGEILFHKLIQQRKEILRFLECVGYAFEEIASVKKGKPIPLDIEDLEGERDESRNSQQIRANINDVYIVLGDRAISHAADANKKAIKEICQGHIERAIEHFVRAERSRGAADAFAQVGKVTSTIASAKGKSRHREANTLRAQIIACWRKEFNQKLSAEKVAEELVGRFRWKNKSFVSHRTIAGWISTEKKKCPSRT